MVDKFKIGEIVWDCNRNEHKILEIRKAPQQKYVIENWLGITHTDYVQKIRTKANNYGKSSF